MVKNVQGLQHVAREAARVAAVGASPSRIDAYIDSCAPAMNTDQITRSYARRSWDQAAGTWSAWVPLGTDGLANDAESGDQVRVTLDYSHPLVAGSLFADALNASDDNRVTLTASVVSLRE